MGSHRLLTTAIPSQRVVTVLTITSVVPEPPVTVEMMVLPLVRRIPTPIPTIPSTAALLLKLASN